MDKQLEALTEAYKILSTAKVQVAGLAASQPYKYLNHASEYITQQANELVQPIFADESRA